MSRFIEGVVRPRHPEGREAQSRNTLVFGEAEPEILRLVNRLFLSANQNTPRMVAFTEPTGTAVRHAICARAAQVLADYSRASVCLVDADVAAPALHRIFNIHEGPGLMGALLKAGPFATYGTPVSEQLTVLPAGTYCANSHGLMASEAARMGFHEMREAFEYTLIVAPPTAGYGISTVLGQVSDGMVLLIDGNVTRHHTALRAKEELERENVQMLGAVFTNRSYPIPQFIYSRL